MATPLTAPAAALLLQLDALSPVDAALAPLHVAIGPRRFSAREVVVPGAAVWAARAGARSCVLAPAEWALLPPWPDRGEPRRAQFTARAETLLEKPSFRQRALRYRALVPVTGFYLRGVPAAAASGIDYALFRAADGCALLLGALYGYSADGNLQVAIVTCRGGHGSALRARRHPLVVAASDASRWLHATARSDLDALLATGLPALTSRPAHILRSAP